MYQAMSVDVSLGALCEQLVTDQRPGCKRAIVAAHGQRQGYHLEVPDGTAIARLAPAGCMPAARLPTAPARSLPPPAVPAVATSSTRAPARWLAAGAHPTQDRPVDGRHRRAAWAGPPQRHPGR